MYRSRYGKDNIILSDIKMPTTKILEEGKTSKTVMYITKVVTLLLWDVGVLHPPPPPPPSHVLSVLDECEISLQHYK